MAADGPEVGFVAGNHGGADAAGRQGDQNVEGQFPNFGGVTLLSKLAGVEH